jgi:hypothetical protein
VKDRDRILTRVGTDSIPERGKAKLVRPAKAAGRAFKSPGPPLGSFTKEMQAFVLPAGKQRALPRPDSGTAGGLW